MSETRKVVAYGRKKQNFITVKSRRSLLHSPSSTPPCRKQEAVQVDDEEPYAPIDFIPEPNKPSFREAMENARRQQTNKENAVQTGSTRRSVKLTDDEPTRLSDAKPKRPKKVAACRARARVSVLSVPAPASKSTKSSAGARYPLAVKAAIQQIKAPSVESVEIITIDGDGSELWREERNPTPSVVDLCSPSSSPAPRRKVGKSKQTLKPAPSGTPRKTRVKQLQVLSDESESEEDEPIVFSPSKKSASRQRKLVVISDEEDVESSSPNFNESEDQSLTQPQPKARPNTGPDSVQPKPAAESRRVGSVRQSIHPRASLSQKTLSGGYTRARVSEAIASLPKDVIDSIARTGDLNAALQHLTPRTRRHLADEEELENVTSSHPKSPNPAPLDKVTEGMGKLDLKERSKSSQSATSSTQTKESTSPALRDILKTCNQAKVLDFGKFVAEFPIDKLHGRQASQVSFRKVGEASYSEVFAIGEVVIKVVPLLSGNGITGLADRGSGPELPSSTPPSDVNQEIMITREIGELQSRFIKLIRAVVVKGAYPDVLLEQWDEYNEAKGSENVRPGGFPPSTHYAIIILPNGGMDLESYVFPRRGGWKTAVSIWWQVARALGVAEDACQFEHRDLHWGQVLVKDSPKDSGGVAATIIDFGLSRMTNAHGNPLSTVFESEVFDGKGDYQFDVYRMMKAHVGDDWTQFKPLTNVMWLHYLAVKLLKNKGLRRPTVTRRLSGRTNPTATDLEREEERVYYDTLVEIEAYLGKTVKTASRRGKKVQPKDTALPKSACDVLIWLAERTKDDDDDEEEEEE